MENGVERESGAAVDVVVFSEEEVREISGLKRGDDYVEVTCGCTSHRYGDAVGRLRVFVTGDLEITCECTPGCQEGLSLSLSSMHVVLIIYIYMYRLVLKLILRHSVLSSLLYDRM
ncbi:hypothetical protein HYC85_014338 [Camellia sinensis]|uniref:ULTRAPETALA1/2 SAND domain-containing protein n=1 Tax=Camellia sinensis TaxID=4442 RepID=A0A7J7H807_CAMSI|nr:hypothetical protein HYC85_014338 [Camellia sinensis]